MKLTNSRLQQLIQEETDAVLNEVEWWDKLKSKASDIGGKITGKDWKAGKQLTKRGRAMDPKSSTYAGVDPDTAKYMAGRATEEAEGTVGGKAPKKYDLATPGEDVTQSIQDKIAGDKARAADMAKDPTQSWMLPAEQERMRKGIGYTQVRRQGSRASGLGKFIPPDIYAHPTQPGKYLKYDPNEPAPANAGRGYHMARNRMEAEKTKHMDPWGEHYPDWDPGDTHAEKRAKRKARFKADPVKSMKHAAYRTLDDPLVDVASLHPAVGVPRSIASMVRTAEDPTITDEERASQIAWKGGKEFLPKPARTALKGIRAVGQGDPGERAIASTFEKGGGGRRRYTPELGFPDDPKLPPEQQGRGRRGTAQARAAHKLQQAQAKASTDPKGASGVDGLSNKQLASRNEFRIDLRGRGFDRNAIAGIERQATRLASAAGTRGMPYGDALAMASQDAIRTRQRARATQVAATGEATADAKAKDRSWAVREHKDSILTRLENLIKEETTTFLKKQS